MKAARAPWQENPDGLAITPRASPQGMLCIVREDHNKVNQSPWRKRARWMTATAVTTALLLSPVAIHAQESQTTNDTSTTEDDGTITITATKTPRMVDFTPGEVSIITKKQLDQRQVQNLQDIVRYEPGVEVINGTRGIGQKPVIRGMSNERVLINLDGTRINFDSGHKGQFFLDPQWIKRVEVLRGPGSALYGSNAMGGVLSLQTIDPADLLDAGKSFGFKQSIGFQGVDDALTSSTSIFGNADQQGDLQYLFSYRYRQAFDDIQDGNGGDIPYSQDELNSGLAKVLWNMSDEDKLTFSYLTYNQEQQTPSNTAGTTPDPSDNPLVDRTTFQQNWRINYTHQDIDNPLWDLNGTVYYSRMQIKEELTAGGQNDKINYDTLGFDLRNTSRFEADSFSLALTYGMEYYRDTQSATRNGGSLQLFPDAQTENLAAYIQAEIGLFDDLLTIIPGARVDWFTLEADGQQDADYNHVSPKIGALLTLDDELNLKDGDYVVIEGSYGESFRAPSFGESFISGLHFVSGGITAYWLPNPDLIPETSWTAEGGVRVKFDRFKARANYFHTSAENFIDADVTFVPPATLNFQYVNVSQATIHGVELSSEWELLDNLYLWGNYTNTVGDNETTGEPLGSVPPQNAKVGIDYLFANLGLTTGVRMRWYDDHDHVPAGDPTYDGFTLVDFVSTWKPTGMNTPQWINGLSVSFALENLADEDFTWYTGNPGHGINPSVMVSYTKSW
jgi:hemoglobin/transferrin/lactoferrin receptor protein